MSTFQLSRNAVPVIVLAAVLLLAASAAWRDYLRLATYLLPLPGSATQTVAMNPALDTGSVPPSARSALPDARLFGELTPSLAQGKGQATAVGPTSVDDSALPVSTAPYRLFGIIDAALDRNRRVVIGTGDADQLEYAIGDEAPDGAKVHSIRARAVILDRAGVLERLDLPVQSDDSMAGLGAGRDEARAAKLTPAPALPRAFDPAALPVMGQGTAAFPDDEPHAD
jgi:hypothetical protein